MLARSVLLVAALAALAALAATAQPAAAQVQVPPLDITKLKYDPVGFLKPGASIPPDYGKACDAIKGQRQGKIFNPSGTWNSFDTTVYENFCLPYRDQGDTTTDDPDGNGGEARYGYCANPGPTDPASNAFTGGEAGTCPNHQLEYIDYYRATMMEILKDFGPTYQEYEFSTAEGTGRNPAVIVAGADAPDEHIVIGSHYDQIPSAPGSFWDSQEGHAEMIRVAKLMADYWKATGTRPSATIKFVPMDAEEDGSLGSRDYVNNVIVPGGESKVRSYWNADPCAGGYPARRYGNPADVIPINVQIGVETNRPRVQKFNDSVTNTVEQVLTAVDDRITSYPGSLETFVSTSEDPLLTDMGKHIFVTDERPVLFSSDWSNFIAKGIPIFNPTPKVTGPGQGSEPSLLTLQNPYPDGVFGFHSPMDNIQTMARFTGDPTGSTYPEAYMKGMEFCSNLLAWGMLQPNAGGAQTANEDVVAYYEALPNEATAKKPVTFDAGGSYQYADVATRTLVDEALLSYAWDFGDGSTATGRVVDHAYAARGEYASKLTVTNTATGASRSMSVPIVVK